MKLRTLSIISLVTILSSGCSSYKNVPYIQDSDALSSIEQVLPMYDAKIMPKDLLTITVNTTDPDAAAPFNMTIRTSSSTSGSVSFNQQATLQQYLVDNEGTIEFPVLGSLKLGGLTKGEAENLICEKLGNYLKETPIVTVRMANYKISVLGEVAAPGMFTITDEKVNILEALALAGDMTIWGKRDNVKLIREDATGQKEIICLNLNKADIITSPYYYLQQNDILYVTPNKNKAKSSDIGENTSLWFSGTSIIISILGTIATLLLL